MKRISNKKMQQVYNHLLKANQILDSDEELAASGDNIECIFDELRILQTLIENMHWVN